MWQKMLLRTPDPLCTCERVWARDYFRFSERVWERGTTKSRNEEMRNEKQKRRNKKWKWGNEIEHGSSLFLISSLLLEYCMGTRLVQCGGLGTWDPIWCRPSTLHNNNLCNCKKKKMSATAIFYCHKSAFSCTCGAICMFWWAHGVLDHSAVRMNAICICFSVLYNVL